MALVALLWPVGHANAQGVTTGAVTGIVTDEQQQPLSILPAGATRFSSELMC